MFSPPPLIYWWNQTESISMLNAESQGKWDLCPWSPICADEEVEVCSIQGTWYKGTRMNSHVGLTALQVLMEIVTLYGCHGFLDAKVFRSGQTVEGEVAGHGREKSYAWSLDGRRWRHDGHTDGCDRQYGIVIVAITWKCWHVKQVACRPRSTPCIPK